ncbi:MAG: uroporphyrinogen-III synthase [Chloroflexi bacterium]|nr:MAG: uroporphyrinogen-III synthase [Chloroflexota bacterium]
MFEQNGTVNRKRVVVTREAEQGMAFCRKLLAAGFEPVLFPVIQFVPRHSDALDAALRHLDSFDWLVLTSGNAVRFFCQRADELGVAVAGVQIAVSGAATAHKLQAFGLTADFVPEKFVGESLVTGLGDLRGKRVLLPRSRQGRPEIVAQLRAQGADVVEVGLYDTITAVPDATALAELQRGVDVITFASPSSVRNFWQIIHKYGVENVLDRALVACIGPVTAEAAQAAGLTVHVMPATYTLDALIEALREQMLTTNNQTG